MTKTEAFLNAARRQKRRRGVTLVEVLIVVAIMALIAGGVGFLVLPKYKDSQISTAKTKAKAIRQVATQYMALKSQGQCPDVPLLIAERELEPENELDPWGERYVIGCDGDDISVFSTGPDRKDGTEDDIAVPEVAAPAEG